MWKRDGYGDWTVEGEWEDGLLHGKAVGNLPGYRDEYEARVEESMGNSSDTSMMMVANRWSTRTEIGMGGAEDGIKMESSMRTQYGRMAI